MTHDDNKQAPPPSSQKLGDDPMQLRGTCEDPRLVKAGYIVCGSHGDTEWHWQAPGGRWNDGFKSEEAAVKAALRALATTEGSDNG